MDLETIKKALEDAIKRLESIDFSPLLEASEKTKHRMLNNNKKVQKAYDVLFNLNSKIEKEISKEFDEENNNQGDTERCMNNLEKFNSCMPSIEDLVDNHIPRIN